ncbi:pyridoxamine kinase [Luoshenia tenuis]|jgi:pyridoxine kinase|uniref:pyridoxamine kinase n=2 Tax=Clostridia TaxID=186801 RepID=UPI003D9415AC
MKPQKRVAAIHDISGFGKCSLTVALPIISAAGVETSVIPTAVLSTHTGNIEGFTYRDLTEDILPFARHWKSLGIHFDAIYTGYLGSYEQIGLIEEVIDLLADEDTLVLVDPVMGDYGRMYALLGEDFPEGMRRLCAKADVIIPNYTEAALLLGEPYRDGPYEAAFVEKTLKDLARLGCPRVALTGTWLEEATLGAAVYDAQSGQVTYAMGQRVDGPYHGTGDVFGSALLGALMNDKPLGQAAQVAVDFVVGSILRTKEAGTDWRYGVNFEAGLPAYIRALGLV